MLVTWLLDPLCGGVTLSERFCLSSKLTYLLGSWFILGTGLLIFNLYLKIKNKTAIGAMTLQLKWGVSIYEDVIWDRNVLANRAWAMKTMRGNNCIQMNLSFIQQKHPEIEFRWENTSRKRFDIDICFKTLNNSSMTHLKWINHLTIRKGRFFNMDGSPRIHSCATIPLTYPWRHHNSTIIQVYHVATYSDLDTLQDWSETILNY